MIHFPIKLKDKEMKFVAKHITSLVTSEIIYQMLERDDFTSEQRDFIYKIGKEYEKLFEE